MVGKLIKNELKAGLHFMAPIYIVTAVISALLYILLGKAAETENAPQAGLLILGIGFVCICVFLGTIISVISNFNKSMFKDQGYLTFTLPVTSNQLLFSKALCSFLWILLSYIITLALLAGAFFSMFFNLMEKYDAENIEITADLIINMLSGVVNLPWTNLADILSAIISIVIFAVIYLFITTLHTVSQIYFSVSLSNIRPLDKFGMFSTIGVYFIVWASTSIISTIINSSIPFGLKIGLTGVETVADFSVLDPTKTMLFGMGDLVFPVIATVFFFFMTSWFMKHKINLK